MVTHHLDTLSAADRNAVLYTGELVATGRPRDRVDHPFIRNAGGDRGGG
jgi:ABC-type transport system involved in cytochrome bd biosynthesis fused ATPase/permease subunit